MSDIPQYLQTIPKEAWIVLSGFCGAVVGGTITLIATLLKNKADEKKFETQLKHDKDVRIEEREMAMRKEIYYGAIESLAESVKFLLNMAQEDFQNSFEGNYADLSAKYHKLQLIAGTEVIKTFNDHSNLVSQSFFTLAPQKMKLQQLGLEKDQKEQLITNALEYQKEIGLKMEELNRLEKDEDYLWAPLRENAEKTYQEINLLIEEGRLLDQKIFDGRMAFLKEVVNWLKKVSESAGMVIIEMRKELTSSTDNGTLIILEDSIKRSFDKNIILFNEFIKEVDLMAKEAA